MKLKTYKPTTSSQRNLIQLNKTELTKTYLLKTKIKGQKNTAGRNSTGRITAYHKGGGHKRKYREINFNRIIESTGIVISIEHDPYRSANIAAIYNLETNNYFYILAPKNLKIGEISIGFRAIGW